MNTDKEELVTWKNGKLVGEGLWLKSNNDKGVVICHPHPQMGGAMYNNVVEALQGIFAAKGFSTLRFNFRGVGGSTGQYDEGRGEQQDVLSAREFMKAQGIKSIYFAGYSFGAWVGSNVLRGNSSLFEKALMVSPPDKYMKFDWTGLDSSVDVIVCGDIDPFCDTRNLKIIAEKISAKFIVLASVDHFYAGDEQQLADCLDPYLKEKCKKS